MQKLLLVLVASVAIAVATPVLELIAEDGQDIYITPVLSRQRRGEPPQWIGGGGANGQRLSGWLQLQNPNGSGGGISALHHKGYGTDVGVNAMVPVWSRQSRYGDSTVNVGGGLSRHFGGPGGDRMLDSVPVSVATGERSLP